MDADKLARRLFERWKADLTKKPAEAKHTNKSQDNFEELFFELRKHDVSYDVAFEFIKDAATAHFPGYYVIERVWSTVHAGKPGLTKREWMDSWKQCLEENANSAFFCHYEPVADPEELENKHVKETGQMSPIEYAKQRKVANSYDTISLEEVAELRRKREETMKQNLSDLEIDLEDFNG
jgi:hypothetical protein